MTLEEYAKRILELHCKVEATKDDTNHVGRRAVEDALKCGEYLLEAKEKAGHRNWMDWFKANLEGSKNEGRMSIKTAERYMKAVKRVFSSHVTKMRIERDCLGIRQLWIMTGQIPPDMPLDGMPQDNEPVVPANGDEQTPQQLSEELERLRKRSIEVSTRLFSLSPGFEDNHYDANDDIPFPIYLERNFREFINDALNWHDLPPLDLGCEHCGHVREDGEFFLPIPGEPFSHSKQICQNCSWDWDHDFVEKNKPELIANMTKLKALTVGDYTKYQRRQRLDDIAGDLDPALLEEAKEYIWALPNFHNEADTIEAIQSLSPKIVFADDKRTKLLWKAYRHYISSAVFNNVMCGGVTFLVVDESRNNTVLGIGSINHDFPSLAGRDNFIGWTKEQKEKGKLNHIVNASTIVPTQPFGSNFNGGKLIASIISSQTVREQWKDRYHHTLVGMTTTSLFGGFSMYNAMKQWRRLGETTGRVPIRPDLAIYRKWLHYYKTAHAHAYQQLIARKEDATGPITNYMTKMLNLIYQIAGLKPSDYEHGHKRGLYFSEMYENTKDFLCERIPEAELKLKPLFAQSVQEITAQWREKWAIKRYKEQLAAGTLKTEKEFFESPDDESSETTE